MSRRNKLLSWIVFVLFLVGAGIYFSDFFKVVFGITANAVRVVG
jgi:membrane protein implicated in regulation of membrane protease activity